MRTILDIAINDLRVLFKNRSIFINLLVMPLVIGYIIGVVSNGGGGFSSARLIVDVIDADQGAVAQEFMSGLRAVNDNLVLCPQDNDSSDVCQLHEATLDETLAEQRLKDQTSLALIEIPADFSANVEADQNVSIVYRSNESASAPSYILQAVQAETQRLGGALIAARVGTNVAATALDLTDPALSDAIRANASAIWAQNPVPVDYVVSQSSMAATSATKDAGFQQSLPGIGSMYAMLMILAGTAVFITERKDGTLQRLATMPISRAQILGGKLLSRFSTGVIEFALMFGFGILVLHVPFGNDPLAIILLVVSFSLAITALMLVMASLLRNQSQATGISLFLTLTLAPLGGAWWPLDVVPDWMRTVGHISPVAWAMDGFNSVVFNGGDLSTVIVPVLVLLGMTVIFFVIGVARFRFTD